LYCRAARAEEEDLGPPNTEKRFAYSLLEKLLLMCFVTVYL